MDASTWFFLSMYVIIVVLTLLETASSMKIHRWPTCSGAVLWALTLLFGFVILRGFGVL